MGGHIEIPVLHPVTLVSGVTAFGVNRLSTNVTKMMAQLPEMLKDVSGLDMNQMIASFMKTDPAKQMVATTQAPAEHEQTKDS